MKAALEEISERDGTSMNQFLVVAAAEKIAAMETERFFAERKNRADRKAFRRILNRKGGEPPRPDDSGNCGADSKLVRNFAQPPVSGPDQDGPVQQGRG
jgi:hypothetical protein